MQRKRPWAAVAALLAILGALASVLGAHAVARSDAAKARLAFHLASEEVASTLKLAIQHEEDLVVGASAFVRGNPHASAADFDSWAQSVHAMQRFPELQNIGLVALVPASGLAAFKTRLAVNPVRPLGPESAGDTASLQIFPPGPRPYYCIAVAGLARSAASYLPAGLDYCALAPTLITARDSGLAGYAPFVNGGTTMLGVQTPVYRGGVVPSTLTARRRAFVGWLGELLVPKVVLAQAAQSHPNLAVIFRYDSRFSNVAFTRGSAPASAQSAKIDLQFGHGAGFVSPQEGWTVQTFGARVAGGVFGNLNSLILLIGGSLLSVVLSLLGWVLTTERTRALSLVREKTRELSHQVLHDTLTGLPNRALVLDRAEQLLARTARQPGSVAGAMFIDVDGFKYVNDNLGHAAGDQLLRAVAERLRRTVRDQDTAGRFGGDEFVVLVEPTGNEATANVLADRLIEALREPVELDDRQVVSVTGSIGIAVGKYTTPEGLLRDADVALYFAKAAGKDRYEMFDARMHSNAEDRVILVAEDNEISRSVAQALLAKRGLRSAIARNGMQAVRMAKTSEYAAILMDCQMPELDGYEATRRIRRAEDGRHVPIIAMTAHPMTGGRERCLAAGMDDYLTKPVSNDELDDVIERCLSARELGTYDRYAHGADGSSAENGRSGASGDGSDPDPAPAGQAEAVLDHATIEQLRETLSVETRERLIETFDESLAQCVAEMASAVRRGDEMELRHVAQQLKGSCATLGVTRLRSICQRLERSGRVDDPAVSEGELAQLQAIATEAREELHRRLLT